MPRHRPPRRRVLGSIVTTALLAGCITSKSGDSSTTTAAVDESNTAETPTATPVPTPTSPTPTPPTESVLTPSETRQSDVPDSTPFRALRIDVSPDSIPFDHDVSVHVGDDTPQVSVTLTNAGDDSHIVETPTTGLPFPETAGEAVGGGRLLVLRDRSLAGVSGGCQRARITSLPAFDRATLDAGASLTGRYPVFNHVDNDTCWPAGTYRFEETYTVDPEDDARRYRWGFALVV